MGRDWDQPIWGIKSESGHALGGAMETDTVRGAGRVNHDQTETKQTGYREGVQRTTGSDPRTGC